MASREAGEIVGYSPRTVVARTAFATVGQWYFWCFLGWGTDLNSCNWRTNDRCASVPATIAS
jgi:hypothetical protein